jgi:outer membrane scaffolding protein for murein synthesis (MipA/OmpV family)
MFIDQTARPAMPIGRTVRVALLGGAATLFLMTGASAQPDAQDGVSIALGGGLIVTPDYPGSSDLQVLPVPAIDLRADPLFLNFRRGLGLEFELAEGLIAGPFVQPDFGRDEDDDARLTGLGDVDATAELGLFAEWQNGPFEIDGQIARGLGGHDGWVGEIGAGLRTRLGGARLSVGPDIRLADDTYMQSYFGVTATQAAASAFPAFDADGPLLSYGISANLIVPIAENWTFVGIAGFDFLTGDAADSPITEQEFQPSVVLSLTYTF